MSMIVRNLSKSLQAQPILKNLCFEAHPGRVTGFLGPNGAGKSTTMRILAGLLSPDEGSMELGGKDWHPSDPKQRHKMGYLAENNPLYTHMYVREFLTFSGKLHRVRGIRERVNDIIELTGLGPEQHKQIGHLSKGYRQRVGLAQALLHDPEVLILDEATTGLDPNQLVGIRQLIRHLGETKTVLLSTHIMQEVEAVCDDLIIIHQGEIVAQSPLASLQASYGTDRVEELFHRLTK